MAEVDNEVFTFFRILEQEVEDTAHDPETGGVRLMALAKVILARLEEAGLTVAPQTAYFMREAPRANSEVHAFAMETDDDVLTLYAFIDVRGEAPQVVVKADVEAAYRKLKTFAKLAAAGELDAHVEPSQAVSELVAILKQASATLRITYAVITNGVITDKVAGESASDADRNTWDLLRLFRTIGSEVTRESVDVVFDADLGGPLPCLVTPAANGLQVLLACMPGSTLARIYERYRSRLLERNVRSFLQFTGKVNRGIRDTILTAPDRFLAYNNGISATAARVVLRRTTEGVALLESATDFQVVNGGQTTASIASCLRRDKADLAPVFVQMKLTVVPPDRVDALVPLISRYANTQNRIQEADFSANHPYHIELEKKSRQTWTTPTADMPRGTRWFYERSRGQYAVEKLRNATSAGQKKFTQENPSSQKFSKTDLAKYVMSWDQYPQSVSLGAQKNFVQFMQLVEREKRPLPDEPEYHRIVGLAILHKKIEKLYGELGYTGYRAQVVTYTLATLSHQRQRHMEWDKIWADQEVPSAILNRLKDIIVTARNVILAPPGQQNITEWCKKDACWNAMLHAAAGGSAGNSPPDVVVKPVIVDAAEQELIDAVHAVPSGIWLNIASWAKTTDSLTAWDRGFSYNFGVQMAKGKKPSLKQARVASRVGLEAWRLGFRHADVTDSILTRLRTAMAGNEREGQ